MTVRTNFVIHTALLYLQSFDCRVLAYDVPHGARAQIGHLRVGEAPGAGGGVGEEEPETIIENVKMKELSFF